MLIFCHRFRKDSLCCLFTKNFSSVCSRGKTKLRQNKKKQKTSWEITVFRGNFNVNVLIFQVVVETATPAHYNVNNLHSTSQLRARMRNSHHPFGLKVTHSLTRCLSHSLAVTTNRTHGGFFSPLLKLSVICLCCGRYLFLSSASAPTSACSFICSLTRSFQVDKP